MLPVDCIEPSPYQARTAFDEPEIAALAVSILQNGLLQPISVRLSEAPSFGMPINFYEPNGKGCEAYMELAREFLANNER